MTIECYSADEFYTHHNDVFKACYQMLNGIPGKWEFSQYTVNEYGYPGLANSFVCFNDLDDEDRTFTIEWNNMDMPLEKAHIEVAND